MHLEKLDINQHHSKNENNNYFFNKKPIKTISNNTRLIYQKY